MRPLAGSLDAQPSELTNADLDELQLRRKHPRSFTTPPIGTSVSGSRNQVSPLAIIASQRVALSDAAPRFTDAKGASCVFSVSWRTWLRWADQGLVPWGVKISGRRLWNVAELEEFIAGGCKPNRSCQSKKSRSTKGGK